MRISNNATNNHHFANPVLGIRFQPTDEEVIRYLIKFVSSNHYFCNDIQFEDLYGSKKPWELLESLSDVKYYFKIES